ncbi:Crp/Fnr family transcriptional regulator [Chitinophaga horti]|uniref:Crp/Fnr family transcriptional regulator n=1 Tax=Chitinophaga horti TaxID=2920382 RepID=A0ABY6J7Y5_9BACT|nr:Crp/Fnr family transcriptional regulator [Chitinophaga horti]UYQ95712.1 Crp/Fnr family transcriptional regulator [Chitinophaga horti]
MILDAILNNVYRLPAPALQALKGIIRETEYPKCTLLIRANKVEDRIYFIKKGIARAFATRQERDVTFWFGKEGDVLLSMRSYVDQQPGYENITLIEDCFLFELHTPDLMQLYKTDIDIANWGRKFAERELIKTERRLINLQIGTAKQRYEELLAENPTLVQRVPVGYIASYLGISAVSLSRIRAELR